MPSFSALAKSEICREFPSERETALAQCFGVLLFCNSFSADSIKIVTESADFSKMLPKLFKRAFGFGFDSIPADETGGKFVFLINEKSKLKSVMEAYGFSPEDTLSLHVNLPVVEEDSSKSAFLRGAFLAGGSVTDPAKGYHMELATSHQSVAREALTLVEEVLGFYPKSAVRGGGLVLYLKQSELISDFLTYLGAPIAAMGIMEARLEKELNNKVNRRCNCDDANTSKVVDAAQEQLVAIRVLREHNAFDSLPGKLREAANAREENPESSLTELAGLMTPAITKPAMNHRLRRLVDMAKEYEK